LTAFLAVNKTGVSFAAAGVCISDAPKHRLAGVSLLSFLHIVESPQCRVTAKGLREQIDQYQDTPASEGMDFQTNSELTLQLPRFRVETRF